jgi:hypothetical protein
MNPVFQPRKAPRPMGDGLDRKYEAGFGAGFGYIAGMRKRGRIVLAAVIFAVLGGLVWWVMMPRPPDPFYNGHRLSYWVSGAPGGVWSDPTPLDSNAVPYLVQALKSRDTALNIAYNRLWPHLPVWLRSQVWIPNHGAGRRFVSCRLLIKMGASARPAIPELLRILKEDNESPVRVMATDALRSIANRDDKDVIQALVAATKDKDPTVSMQAVGALQNLAPGPVAKAGVKLGK